MNFNKLIILGRLTKDPELRHTQGGMSMAKFSIAYNHKRKDTEQVHYFDCTAWGRSAEVLTEHAGKGSPLLIEGRLEQHRWETDDGSKRSKVEITVENFTFIGGKNDESRVAGGDRGSVRLPPLRQAQQDDDIPF